MNPENVEATDGNAAAQALSSKDYGSTRDVASTTSPQDKAKDSRGGLRFSRSSGSRVVSHDSISSLSKLGAKKGPVTDSDESFKARCLSELDPSRPMSERISAAEQLCPQIQNRSADAIQTLWTVAEDLTADDAPLEARKIGFALLRASAPESGLSELRQKHFSMIITRVNSAYTSLQILALSTLTNEGQDTSPFEQELVHFLNPFLENLFWAATDARERRAEDVKDREAATSDQSPQNKPTQGKSHPSKGMIGEVKGLRDTFYFLTNIVTQRPNAFNGENLDSLIQRLTMIARKTTSKKDMHGVTKVFRAITGYATLPSSNLESCVNMLCTIFGLADIKFEEEIWLCFRNLLSSPDAGQAIGILVNIPIKDVQGGSDAKKSNTTVRGALLVIQKIAEDQGLAILLDRDIELLSTHLSEITKYPIEMHFEAVKTVNTLFGCHSSSFNIDSWLDLTVKIVEEGSGWDIYWHVLTHLPAHLSRRSLFAPHVRQLQTLQNILITQLDKSSFRKPHQHLPTTPGDVALCLYNILTVLVAYNELFSRRELDNSVRVFSMGINKWDKAGRCCIHALALCCHEIPSVIDRHIFAIIQKMSQKITHAGLAIDILEFLLGLVRLPDAYSSATAKLPQAHSGGHEEDGSFYKTIFGICTKYIQSAREQRSERASIPSARSSLRNHRQSGVSAAAMQASEANSLAEEVSEDLSEYVHTIAYHVIIFWFLAIDVRQRSQHVGWISKELALKEKAGKDLPDIELLDEQSQVILDMMHRTAFSDLGETEPAVAFKDPSRTPIKKTWLTGMSVVTLEILAGLNTGQFTKRQASGTTHALYYHTTNALPEHHIRDRNSTAELSIQELVDVYPNHMFLQLASTIAPSPIPLQPVVLPDDEFAQRALRNFDRIDTVDGHKAGVIYVAQGQKTEVEVLANNHGSKIYESFLSGLGTSVKLEGAKFNTQGLDRESGIDGTHTYAWRDRVAEIVFHVATMMPTDLTSDPHCDSKKRHIGNDRVNIIFNDSGEPFAFNTIASDFNEINIVVTPHDQVACQTSTGMDAESIAARADFTSPLKSARTGYYKVEMLRAPEFPYLSPASSPKIVCAEVLPGFVRQLTLNASVFCQVWSEVRGQGKFTSSWRARLQEINRLRARYGNTHSSANVSYPMPNTASTYVDGDDWKGKVTMGGLAELNQLLMSLDFTRWT